MHKFYFFLLISTSLFSQKFDFKKFKGTPIKVSYLKEITSQSMYIYVDNSYTEAKTDDQLSLIHNQLNLDVKNITPIFRYTFLFEGQQYAIYKFNKKTNDVDLKTYTQLFFYKGNSWEKVDKPSELVSAFFNTLNIVNLEFYKAITSSSDNPKYPEINKLKPLVKNISEVIDIEKLAKVIRDNKSTLSKYVDQ